MNMMPQYNPYMNQYTQRLNMYQQPTNGITWVQGIEGAKAFQLSPNSNTILMDSESDTFYIKTCDNVGMCTLRTYKYSEVQEHLSTNNQQNVDMSKYVTREEVEKMIANIGGLDDGKSIISATNKTVNANEPTSSANHGTSKK